MDYRDADPHLAGSPGKTADAATAEFLRGLRQLRKQAGLGHAELAGRAHYPYEAITAAEAGPSLPDLPLLAAFVRGCGGSGTDIAEWEDWWRAVGYVRTVPLPTARGGRHAVAVEAGARAAAARVPFAEAASEPLGRVTVPHMRPPADGPLARDIPRDSGASPSTGPGAGPSASPSAPTVTEPRPRGVRNGSRTAPPTPAWPDGQQHAMSDLALAVVVIVASAVCAIAILVTVLS